MKRLFFIAFSTLIPFSGNSQSHTNIKVLFLGNSYTYVNNLPQLIHDIAWANGDTLVFDSNCPGGFTFNNHFSNTTSISKINSQAWDYVVLQAQSQEPSFSPGQVASQTLPFAIKLDSVINHNDSCTKTVFYETWGRKYGDASNCSAYPPVCTYTGMQDRLKESYKLFADTCLAMMSPAGEAWRKSIGLNPSLELYQADQSHPSLEGSYLTACVFYEALFRKSVLANSFNAGITASTVGFLQQVAHDVVNDSLDVWNIGKYDPCSATIINDLVSEGTLRIFPNPANAALNLSFPEAWSKKNFSYKILDLPGRIYAQGEITNGAVSISALTTGFYFIEIQNDGRAYVLKFIKQ